MICVDFMQAHHRANKLWLGKNKRPDFFVCKVTMFIVLEGCDAVGKTSQATELARRLGAELVRFPDRTTPLGGQLNALLQGELKLELHATHLLFTANRWELQKKIAALLDDNKTVVCDRYSGSGVAYSVASGLSLEWCLAMERNLLVPDAVVLLDNPDLAELQARRSLSCSEVFDKIDFQTKVRQVYLELAARFEWNVVRTTSFEETSEDIFTSLSGRFTHKTKVTYQIKTMQTNQEEQVLKEQEEEQEDQGRKVQDEAQKEEEEEEEEEATLRTTQVEWRDTPTGYKVVCAPREPYGKRI